MLCMLYWHPISWADSTENDLSELSNLASLDGESYITARNQWLQTHTTPIDLDQAAVKGWAEGLQGLIINARIADPNLFESWDKSGFTMDHIGRPVWAPNPRAFKYPRDFVLERNYYIYCIEAIWKFREAGVKEEVRYSPGIWPKYVLDAKNITLTLINQKEVLPGSLELWRKIESECQHPRLKSVAGAALVFTVDESETMRKLMEDRLRSPTVSEIAKKGIFNALKSKRPAHTNTILINSYPGWKQDPNLAIIGLPTIASQPDPAGRNFVRQIMMDPTQQEDIRVIAINAISEIHDIGDIDHLKYILEDVDSLLLKRRAVVALSGYPYTLTRPIIYPALAAQTDPETLRQLLYIVERWRTYASEEDVRQLENFMQRPEFAEKLVKQQVVQTLESIRSQLNIMEN